MCEPTRAPLRLPPPMRPEPEPAMQRVAAMLPPIAAPCAPAPAEAAAGSRRRRLWQLPGHAFCPVIGVCLPLATVRQLVGKALGGAALADDYELHCGVIAECRQRGAIAERVQRELDRRYAAALRRSAALKSTPALADWWGTELQGAAVAGALWATLSHPRCDAPLTERVLQDMHLLQHQLGAAERADRLALQRLQQAHEQVQQAMAQAQQRHAQQAEAAALRLESLQAQLLQLRAELIGRDTLVAQLREAGDPTRQAQAALREQQLVDENAALRRALQRQQAQAEQLQRALARASAVCPPPSPTPSATPAPAPAQATAPAVDLADRAVLCVGGRQASVPLYRALVERTGGRFLHHDGGEEHSTAALEATLAAADLVICQTGCVSHDAYWRVKDHCKRTGKRCVYVDKPSRAGLVRVLRALPAEPATDAQRA